MKKLIVLGEEKNWNDELELFSNDKYPYGFNCKITYVEAYQLDKETRHNCTEFHHRYDKAFNIELHNDGERESSLWERDMELHLTDNSAFESDIHSTGGTKRLSYIKSIEVVAADKVHENY